MLKVKKKIDKIPGAFSIKVGACALLSLLFIVASSGYSSTLGWSELIHMAPLVIGFSNSGITSILYYVLLFHIITAALYMLIGAFDKSN